MNISVISIILLLAYLLPSFAFDFIFDFWDGFAPYYFEIGFVAICLALFRKKISFKIDEKSKLGKSSFVYLFSGIIAVVFARLFSTEIPFNFKSKGVVIFLIFLGPLLEELIYRFSLWHLFEQVTKCAKGTLLITTAIFSLAHFKSVFLIGHPFQTFIVFQSLYTLILGRQLGERYMHRRSLTEIVLLHSFFNFGFWLGAVVLY